MKREMIIILGILLVGISACAQDFAPQDSPEKQLLEKAVYQQAPADSNTMIDKVLPTPAEPVEAKKQSETECVEFWKKINKEGSKILFFEDGQVRISFKSRVTFAEALNLLKKYDIEKKKIAGIFMRPNVNEEQQYNNNKAIVGNVQKGEEIETACKILQESAIDNATPEVTLGFASQ